jgi:cysteine desulfurase family protein (TIGR01976 family)
VKKSLIDFSTLREQFPALQQRDSQGRPFIYFDGPGGTQVPQRVIEAMTRYYVSMNSNTRGQFLTSQRTDETIQAARVAMADFLNAPSPEQIIFGANMTTLTFHLSRSLAKFLSPGDEVIVTRLDHDANISPWLALQENGAVIRWLDFHPEDCTLDLGALERLLNRRTKLFAVGYASNAVGTINDVKRLARIAHEAGAMMFIDAVHYAPHGSIDVQDIDCDFLVCSAYKFFGPHLGALYGKRESLDKLISYKVRPQSNALPNKFETGTLNHEGLAGTASAIDYLADIGKNTESRAVESFMHLQDRRHELKMAMQAIQSYENELSRHLIAGLKKISGIKIYGITDEARFSQRTPTFAIRLAHSSPEDVARRLGQQGIFVWDGNFYAFEATARLGVEESGGVVRIGLVHYNTMDEIDRLIDVLQEIGG